MEHRISLMAHVSIALQLYVLKRSRKNATRDGLGERRKETNSMRLCLGAPFNHVLLKVLRSVNIREVLNLPRQLDTNGKSENFT